MTVASWPSEGTSLDLQIARWGSGGADGSVFLRIGGLIEGRNDDAVYVGVGEFGCAPASSETCQDEGE